MHNGGIAEFPKIKRKLQASLSDELFDVVLGNTGIYIYKLELYHHNTPFTDSEWAFALFLSKVGKVVCLLISQLT